jgi:hypothetical protein
MRKQLFWIAGLLFAVALAPSVARADEPEPDPFAGMVEGIRIPNDELEAYTGRGVDFSFGGGVNNGSVTGVFQSTVASGAFSGSRGILQITQFNGDGNTVNISVNLSVNINTTTITNSTGLSTTVNNGFSLSGGTAGFSGP